MVRLFKVGSNDVVGVLRRQWPFGLLLRSLLLFSVVSLISIAEFMHTHNTNMIGAKDSNLVFHC